MNTKKYIDAIIEAQKGGCQICPRCGHVSMKLPITSNALSRRADGCYVCDNCGMVEALADASQMDDPVENWNLVQLFAHCGLPGEML